MLYKLASDPNATPETQQKALQHALNALHDPIDIYKPYKGPNINDLLSPGAPQTETATTPEAQAGPPHDLSNLQIPGALGRTPGFSSAPGAEQQLQQQTGTRAYQSAAPMPTPPVSAGMPAPSLPQQAQLTTPGAPRMYYTPEEQAQIAGRQHEAVAGGQLRGQIGARQAAIEGGAGPMALGIPGIAGLMGAYGRGDDMPAAVAAQAGYPLPPGTNPSDPNAWVRVQRNKMNEIVGSHAIPIPAQYAPTSREGFTYQTDASGNTIAVPVTTTTQKQLPTQPGSAPTAKVEPSKGTKVGKMKPPQAIMIAPPAEPGGSPTAVAVRPGSKVPAGSVTPGGLSSANVPTSTIRTMAGRSKSQLPAVQRLEAEITRLDKLGKLGPLAGRYNNFMMGKVGAGDPDYAYLKDKTEMLKSAIQLIHTGARGSPPILKKFDAMLDAGKMDAATLRAGLRVMREQLEDYSKEGTIPGFEQPGAGTQQPSTIYARDPQGKLHQAPMGSALPQGWTLEPR